MNLLGKVLFPILMAAPLVAGPVGMAAASCAKMTRQCEMAEQKPTAKVGEPAPNFTLDAVVGKEFKQVSLAAYRGKWVVLFFYPLDFTFVCPTEIKGFNAALDAFTHPLVMSREFLYVYKGKGLPPGKGSYSFRYWLGAWDHTLSSEQIEEFRNALLAFLQTEGISLRG